MLYFAYGSNMERHHMKRRCRSAKFVAAARLRDYELNFTGISTMWGGGVADLKPVNGGVVEGVLWEIGEADLKELDDYEGYPKVYVRKNIDVETLDGRKMQAFAYFMVRPGTYKAPSRRYMRLLVSGAEEHDLSDEYVMRLEAIRTSG
ncbi:MAG: gamma-glutamylcyclotransferase family protein [Candidatus Methylomirabilales bacterium]